MLKIGVVDYGMGNLYSVCKALEKVRAFPQVIDNPTDITKYHAIVLPGVGAFDSAMYQLRSRKLVEPIRETIAQGKPFLGICLGLQLLFEGSDEGQESGLGVIPGWTTRFESEPGLTIPHMGWNQLEISQPHSLMWLGLPPQPWVYFVHSYHVKPDDMHIQTATVTHGSQQAIAAIIQRNLIGVQFHPEKSATVGLQILSNFVHQAEVTICQHRP